MQNIGRLFRLGMWTVGPDNVPEFIEAWQSAADWIVQNVADDGEAFLLHDSDNPGKFVSFASSSDPEKSEAVMSRQEFQVLWSRVQELSEEVRPHRMHVAGYAGGSSGYGGLSSE